MNMDELLLAIIIVIIYNWTGWGENDNKWLQINYYYCYNLQVNRLQKKQEKKAVIINEYELIIITITIYNGTGCIIIYF